MSKESYQQWLAEKGEKEYPDRPKHIRTASLNRDPQFTVDNRQTRVFAYGEKALQQIASFAFEFDYGIDGSKHEVVAVRIHHHDCSPWQRVAIVDVQIYLDLLSREVPMRWAMAKDETPRVSVSRYDRDGTIKHAQLSIPRLVYEPSKKMYLRWVYSPLLLLKDPPSFVQTKPSRVTRRVAEKLKDVEALLSAHRAYTAQRYGSGHVYLQDPSKYLVPQDKVSLKYFATLNDA
jgi:hypothetical protein